MAPGRMANSSSFTDRKWCSDETHHALSDCDAPPDDCCGRACTEGRHLFVPVPEGDADCPRDRNGRSLCYAGTRGGCGLLEPRRALKRVIRPACRNVHLLAL